MQRRKIEHIIKLTAIISFVILFICGVIYYYNDEEYDILYKISFIVNNAISSFAFKPDISLEKMLSFLYSNKNYPSIIGYIYALVLNVAPLCTVVFFYEAFRKLYNITSWLTPLLLRNKSRIFIIGYNETVKEWCLDNAKREKKDKKNLIVIADDDTDDNDLNVLIDTKTWFKKKETDNIKYNYFEYLKKQKLSIKDRIIIFNDRSEYNSSVENLSTLLKLSKGKEGIMPKGMNIDIFCDDNSVHSLIEEVNEYEKNKADKNADEHNKEEKKYKYNIETFDYKELIVRKALIDAPLYSYYNNIKTSLDEMTIHMMIVGFGGYGQNFLIQSMNLAVLGSKNNIIIDIIDKDIEKTKIDIDNMFSNSYVKLRLEESIGDYEYNISGDSADGSLTIRLHNVDCKSEKLKETFKRIYMDEPINNIVIALPSNDIIYNTFRFIQEEILTDDEKSLPKGKINIYIKVVNERDSELYFNNEDCKEKENSFYENDLSDRLNIVWFRSRLSSIDDVISNNKIYSNFKEVFDAEEFIKVNNFNTEKSGLNKVSKERQISKDIDNREHWLKKSIYDKESILARACSVFYIKWALCKFAELNWDLKQNDFSKVIKKTMSIIEESNLFSSDDDKTVFMCKNNIDETIAIIEKNNFINEFVIAEHRRWCYYLASKGWGRSTLEKYLEYDELIQNSNNDNDTEKYRIMRKKYHKRPFLKKHVCMCDWNTLKTKLKKFCIYDIKPLIYISYGYLKL